MRKLHLEAIGLALLWIVVILVITRPTDARDTIVQHVTTSVTTRVLQDFSALVGTTVTMNDVQNLTVTSKVFYSTALDCPKPNIGYAQVQVQGYIVTFKYQGIAFDYRADVRLTNVFLCHVKVK